jgi:hypothetical protein
MKKLTIVKIFAALCVAALIITGLVFLILKLSKKDPIEPTDPAVGTWYFEDGSMPDVTISKNDEGTYFETTNNNTTQLHYIEYPSGNLITYIGLTENNYNLDTLTGIIKYVDPNRVFVKVMKKR